jgi:hypothetical protein
LLDVKRQLSIGQKSRVGVGQGDRSDGIPMLPKQGALPPTRKRFEKGAAFHDVPPKVNISVSRCETLEYAFSGQCFDFQAEC